MQNAAYFMYCGAGLSAVSAIVGLATRHDIRRAIERANPNDSVATVNHLVDLLVPVAILGGAIGVALWIWMAVANLRGHKWARICSSVFFGIDTLGLLGSFSQHTTGIAKVVGALTWAVGLGAMILLWQSESSAYFNRPLYPPYPTNPNPYYR